MRTLKLARIVFMIVILGSLLIGPLNMFVYCSPIEGTVPFNCPNVPPPMHEVDLNLKFLSLFAENIVSIHQKRYDVSKLMGTIDGVYFRGYADSVGSFAQTIYYYEKTLVENGWDTLVKIRTHDERIQIHALVISQTIAGLFVMAGDETQTQLVNIVGRIEPERLGEIFENLKAIELEIPQLQLIGNVFSIGTLLDLREKNAKHRIQQPDPVILPTSEISLLTSDGDAIHEIRIQGNEQVRTDRIEWGLKQGPSDIDRAVKVMKAILHLKRATVLL